MSHDTHPDSETTVTTETRQQKLLRTGWATPRFLQGVYPFAGRGVFDLAPLHDDLCYQVPAGKTAQVIYFRPATCPTICSIWPCR